MNVDFIFKIAAIGIVVAVLNQLLQRSGREEQAMMTTIAGLIVVLMMIVTEISNLFDTIKNIFNLQTSKGREYEHYRICRCGNYRRGAVGGAQAVQA